MMWSAIEDAYFKWLCDLVCDKRYLGGRSYAKLLYALHYKWTYLPEYPMDSNREADGMEMRYKFANTMSGFVPGDDIYDNPCSVLEMMVGLSVRCEDTIMGVSEFGSRYYRWFWEMIESMGLADQTDDIYDKHVVDQIVYNMLHHNYSRNGKGGLFTVSENMSHRDMRKAEIWYQMSWYLEDIS